MKNRTLGILAMLGAPFLGIELLLQHQAHTQDMRLAGLMGMPYALGWLGCIWALYRLEAAGSSRNGQAILTIMLFLLSMANAWNIYAAIDPTANTIVYRIMDICWPASNLFMVVVGVAVMRANYWADWRKYVPLAVGFWLPLSVISSLVLGYESMASVLVCSLYSMIMWTLLGYTIYSTDDSSIQTLSL
ncbi:MAG: hypothetical protein JWP57_1194 [Spirosoma sp.]|nr:hypothetical protein [Spirosoma sp.]